MRLLIYLFIFWPLVSLAKDADIARCEGTVLQRRLALAEAGKLAETYLSNNGHLTDFCFEYSEQGNDHISGILESSLACESNGKNILYYLCMQSKTQDSNSGQLTLVLESCSYSLANHKINCENNSVVTSFTE